MVAVGSIVSSQGEEDYLSFLWVKFHPDYLLGRLYFSMNSKYNYRYIENFPIYLLEITCCLPSLLLCLGAHHPDL